MRALRTLQQFMAKTLTQIHKRRFETVFWAVGALMNGMRLSLTAIGRSATGVTYTKHNIKRVDRLLGNRLLHIEFPLFYYMITKLVIGAKTRPVILIDWTGAGDKHWALVAAVPFSGRAIPIYVRVYSEKKNNNPDIHKAFLRELHRNLPTDCKPIIVTDAGFRNVWFKDVLAWGWDFVGRVLHNVYAYSIKEEKWYRAEDLFKKATLSPKDLGNFYLTKGNSLSVPLVLIRKKIKRGNGKPSKDKTKIEARHRANTPWLLVTSLTYATAKRVVDIYSSRMQIEESFRDMKNHRYGWSFSDARSNSKKRKEVLFLIASIGLLALMLLGHTGERLNIHKRYQANTIHSARVLSLFYLGKNILMKEGALKKISVYEILVTLKELNENLLELGYGYRCDSN